MKTKEAPVFFLSIRGRCFEHCAMDLIPTADKSHLDSVNEQQFDRICVSAA